MEPVVIGASGGSGTRVVVDLVAAARHFMGTNLNRSNDAMEFVPFYDRWSNRFIASGDTMNHPRMVRDLERCIERHRAGMPDSFFRWGWKNPRSIYVLPFLDRNLPGMKFIHVVRDGRDMAYSGNQNQLRLHGFAVLRKPYVPFIHDRAVRSMELWNEVNVTAAQYGASHMGDRYLCLRFEDLCREPAATARRLLTFLGEPDAPVAEALGQITPPQSLGRWRFAAAKRNDKLVRAGREGLAMFDYT